MASRSIEVIISARDQFTGTANKVIGSLNRMDSAAGRVGKGVGQVGMGLARVGVIGATAAVGGLTLVAKKTIDWESALAGVNKTMDLTPGELQAIGTDIRKLATEIPLSANALAGLVEQAGALGIAKTDVLAFAEAAATIGVTTNVSADQAASALGGMATLLGLTGKDFERFASTIVDLGNKGASTEDQIIAIAERGAGAAATIGMTTEQLLGWSSALANIKLEPEAAGTSFQRLALGVMKFTRAGGEELKVLAATAGMTGKEFQKAFDEDASGALESFVSGLAKLKKGERLDVLTALGFDDARIARMLLGLAEAQDKTGDLSKSLNVSADAWRANTAAAEEADKRYGTVASKLTLLNNQFTESALLIGEGFLPALGRVSVKLKEALGDESVRNDLRQFGKDIGDFIEGIDFEAVLRGGREFVSVLKGAASFAKLMFDAVNALPGPIKEAGLGFLALNKLSGGLVGAGAANIVGGLAEVGIRGAGSRLPGAAGRLFAQPVFVTNWAMMAGGGLGAGGALGGASIWSKIGTVIGGAFTLVAVASIAEEVHKAITPYGGLEGRVNAGAELPADKLSWPWGPKNTPRWVIDSPFGPINLLGGDSTFTAPPTVGDFGRHAPSGLAATPVRVVNQPAQIGGKSPGERGEIRAQDRAKEMEAILKRGIEAGFHPTELAVQRTFDKNAQHLIDIKNAINAAKNVRPPTVTVNVSVSASNVTHKTIEIKRYGPTGGSRHKSGPLITDP